jgi:probable HAF family extracellular repeat protein
MMKTLFQAPIKLACALALGVVGSSTLAAVRYECRSLETGSFPWAWTNGINSAGEVVGFSDFPSGSRNAARWSTDGAVTELGDLGKYGDAFGINDNGLVVGRSRTVDYDEIPVAWTGTTPTALPLLSGDVDGAAYGVNGRGVIVGISGDYWHGHAVMWRNSKVLDLGTLGDQASQASRTSAAYSINSQGVIVGSSDTGAPDSRHAVWWDTSGQVHDLGTLAGAKRSWAKAVNNKGIIVGESERAAGDSTTRAVAWVDGVVRDLGVLPGYTQSTASAINRSGTVVGNADDGNRTMAVVWPGLNRAPRDLNTLLMGGCEWRGIAYRLTLASGINRDGVIAANGEYIGWDGGPRFAAFKLVPVPANTAAK